MTTPSGQISLDDVNTELDISPGTQINMNAAPVRALAEVPSGAIAMSNLQGKSNAQFIVATGGTITTSGDFKIHTFNSSGTFEVTQGGNAAGSNTVDYLVIAGGASGGQGAALFRGSREPVFAYGAGGGGAGGYRESFPNPASGGLPVSAQAYPITVGAGGAAVGGPPTEHPTRGGNVGSNSVFSSITSAGGGVGGGGQRFSGTVDGGSGGSGGGGGLKSNFGDASTGGTGNSPPVSPPQGNPGAGVSPGGNCRAGGGGGGAGSAGNAGGAFGGPGGNGATSSIDGSPTTRAGGGGGSAHSTPAGSSGGPGGGGAGPGSSADGVAGTTNTGSGGGGGPGNEAYRSSGAGGSGVVIIRYKYQ